MITLKEGLSYIYLDMNEIEVQRVDMLFVHER